jgi:predicted nucleic acid-binding protein
MILDTNGLSAFADGDTELGPVLMRVSEIAVPVIVLGEYKYGIRLSRKRASYERWLKEWMPHFRVLVVDIFSAAEYAEIRDELKRSGRPIPTNDVWIAALARQHELPVISRDQHFDFVSGLKRVSW